MLNLQNERIDHMVGRINELSHSDPMAGVVGSVLKLSESGGPFSKEFEGTMSERISAMAASFDPLFEQMLKLGPEGEVVAAMAQGAFAIGESFLLVAETMEAALDKTNKAFFKELEDLLR